jgi:hypothetical protein
MPAQRGVVPLLDVFEMALCSIGFGTYEKWMVQKLMEPGIIHEELKLSL